MVVPSIGMSGQDQLSRSSILVVGAGGIGSTVLLYLAGDMQCLTTNFKIVGIN